MAAKKLPTLPTTVTYGAGAVKLHRRSDGRIALSWREAGKNCRSTRSTLLAALDYADRKARILDTASGARYLSPAAADRARAFDKLAGGSEAAGRLLSAMESAKEILGDPFAIVEAARYYKEHGPPALLQRHTLKTAVDAFLEEYESHHPSSTVRPVRATLLAFADAHPEIPLAEITREQLEPHVRSGDPAPRTVRNRIAAWTTFFRRAQGLGWYPEAKRPPSTLIKRPRLPDKAPEILTIEQGRKLLLLLKKKKPALLRYAIVAGWLGCRPSECLRLRWRHFDFKANQLHLPPEVVGKTLRERWISLSPEVSRLLFPESIDRDKDSTVCLAKSSAEVSAMARSNRVLASWPADGLRHSFITYRLQVTGSIDSTAEEAGNSPAEIRASYRRPIPPGRGEEWFELLKSAKLQ